MQTWYGEYWLPADIHACAKGTDVLGYAKKKGINYKENWWYKGGYIIVNFDIVTVDSKGNEQLSYTNTNNALNGYCSMWNMENYAQYKTSYQGKVKGSFEFSFEPGDFFVYYSDISLRDDNTTYIIN
jgi:superfamily I DNA and/or RNA helicase